MLESQVLSPLTKFRPDIDELLHRAELEDQRRIEREREEEQRFAAHHQRTAKWSAKSSIAQVRLALARKKIEQQNAVPGDQQEEQVALLRLISSQNTAILDQQEEQAALLRILAAKPL